MEALSLRAPRRWKEPRAATCIHPAASLSQMHTANWKPPGSCSPNTSARPGRQVVNETTSQLGEGKGVEKTSWLPSAAVLEGSEGGASLGDC